MKRNKGKLRNKSRDQMKMEVMKERKNTARREERR
jgi:hypothetical protein